MVPAAGQDEIPTFSTRGGQILARPHWTVWGDKPSPSTTLVLLSQFPVPSPLPKVKRRPMVAKPPLIPLPRRSH